LPLSPGFERARLSSPRCLTCLLGLQGVQWVRGLVVVRVSWPGHPGLPKKKKNILVKIVKMSWKKKTILVEKIKVSRKKDTELRK